MQVPGKIPADIAFIIRDKPHATFSREGSNLVYHAKLALREALCGCKVEVPVLGGAKRLKLDLEGEVVSPSTTKVLQGYGLPLPKQPGRKGDLVVKFDIEFPKTLSSEQKNVIFEALRK